MGDRDQAVHQQIFINATKCKAPCSVLWAAIRAALDFTVELGFAVSDEKNYLWHARAYGAYGC